ncbi:uncharacterized protein N7446_010655 [Penicillium canescens]|uniref:Uncharacterized protein n=1 Tax=Penicillium canescens TaxID=5083 RepID=A0AAD6N8F1_PENCN|nr:uncharacterized protein N7446_010655 [Penicillium canescens]KAJ6041458.1 hypothetical protein N7460_006848 [Penicillium canescens]KAJ6050546.1 hypothetical protein N7446_010655 [Penicillium canescens]KAJ6064851.1 hypothetical protein N7444_000504 [Penicillium canescens]
MMKVPSNTDTFGPGIPLYYAQSEKLSESPYGMPWDGPKLSEARTASALIKHFDPVAISARMSLLIKQGDDDEVVESLPFYLSLDTRLAKVYETIRTKTKDMGDDKKPHLIIESFEQDLAYRTFANTNDTDERNSYKPNLRVIYFNVTYKIHIE